MATIDLNPIVTEKYHYECTIDGTSVSLSSFFIHRRESTITTIVAEFAEDVYTFVSGEVGSEMIINWVSDSFTGLVGNALIQDVRYELDHSGRKVKVNAYRDIAGPTADTMIFDNIQKQITDLKTGNVSGIESIVLPDLALGDTLTIGGVNYTVDNFKITVNQQADKMAVNFG